jgi:hypothetical protein
VILGGISVSVHLQNRAPAFMKRSAILHAVKRGGMSTAQMSPRLERCALSVSKSSIFADEHEQVISNERWYKEGAPSLGKWFSNQMRNSFIHPASNAIPDLMSLNSTREHWVQYHDKQNNYHGATRRV